MAAQMIDVEPKSGGEAGFTLLELLVAIALLGLLSTVLFSVISAMQHSMKAVDGLAASNVMPTVRDFLHNSISKTRRLGDLTSKTGGTASLRGSSNELHFVSNSRRPGHVAGIYAIRIRIEARANSGRLRDLVAYLALVRPTGIQSQTKRVVLLENVTSVSFQYFGALRRGTDAQWISAWSSKVSHPHLVAIDVAFPKRSPHRWPRLVIELAMS